MTVQPQLLQIPLDKKDVVYTPDWVARDMVDFFKPSGRILEPCKGDGVFLKYLPKNTEWCEIQEGRDFFKWLQPVDWCFGNPPYKMFNEWFYHSMDISKNIVYALPCNKPFNDFGFIKRLRGWGGIVHMRIYGRGEKLYFPMGYPVSSVHFQRGYTGPMYQSLYGKG